MKLSIARDVLQELKEARAEFAQVGLDAPDSVGEAILAKTLDLRREINAALIAAEEPGNADDHPTT